LAIARAELEQAIDKRLAGFNEPEGSKTRRLVRALAITVLQQEFEVTYRLIFGSQLDLLLRANAGGIDLPAAQAIFENAKALFPAVHQSATFDQWFSFPHNSRLVQWNADHTRILITERGKEFMQYLVTAGLTSPKSG
jgi:hypothetical protein